MVRAREERIWGEEMKEIRIVRVSTRKGTSRRKVLWEMGGR